METGDAIVHKVLYKLINMTFLCPVSVPQDIPKLKERLSLSSAATHVNLNLQISFN